MSVKKDACGRRYVQAEVEVPGTPEEVWQAIATGPGVSSWFVPTEVEPREGGTAVAHFSPDGSMDSVAKVTVWDPPRRFVAESRDLGPDSPTIATEWIVEARAGGTCVVRVVHNWFADGDDWDAQFEEFASGWPGFFRILRLYLTHFRGLPCAAFQLMGAAPEPVNDAWNAFTTALGIAQAGAGARIRTAAGAPTLAGLVEQAPQGEWRELLVRLDEPTPGIAHLFAMPMGGQVLLPIRLYLYGERAAAVVARDEPRWQSWSSKMFPMPAGPDGAGSAPS